MKTAIILHGMPSREGYYDPSRPTESNSHWLPWIQKQLVLRDTNAQTPEMPEPYNPDYQKWKRLFERFEINENTILVGHSCGGGFLVRWLSESDIKVGKVALIAPWINPHDKRPTPGFFDFKVDDNLVDKTDGITLFISSDDDREELDTAELLKNSIEGLQVMEFADRGHFCYSDMNTEEFPELLSWLTK